DYWDVKQPGLFWFYLIGGKFFGFDEVGIHGFELLYMISFAVVLTLTLRNYFERKWGHVLAALMMVGYYYGLNGVPHPRLGLDYLTQVEGLVAFPLFLCLWFSVKGARTSKFWQL